MSEIELGRAFLLTITADFFGYILIQEYFIGAHRNQEQKENGRQKVVSS
jgi:hypothetical protein